MVNNAHKAHYTGLLDLNGIRISCAVLDDGTRVLVNRSLATELGIKGGGAYWSKKKQGGALLPEYLSAKYLQPFIPKDLRLKLLNPIPYINDRGVLTEAIPAEYLSDICDIFVKAGENGAFAENQDVAQKAYSILLALSKVGIIALVDEATGYQYDREKDELQKLLKAYISEELLPWQKRFPDVYYKELFRLNGWNFTVGDVKKRPSVIGKWTNTLIYEQLPKGILAELKKKTPKSSRGNYTARLHQSLTLDIGEPSLTAQITKIIALFQVSDNMRQLWALFEKMKNRENGVQEIPFEFDDDGHTIHVIEKPEEPSQFNKSLIKALNYNPKDEETPSE